MSSKKVVKKFRRRIGRVRRGKRLGIIKSV